MPALANVIRCAAAILVAAASTARAEPRDRQDGTAAPTADMVCQPTRRILPRAAMLLDNAGTFAIVAQGAGAEADRLLLRGFDAGPGSEVAVFIDGIPRNIGGHLRAHGYAQTHVALPIVTDAVKLSSGNFDPTIGEFSSAGAIRIETCDRLAEDGVYIRPMTGIYVGQGRLQDRVKRLTHGVEAVASGRIGPATALFAADFGIDDGPFVHPMRARHGLLWGKAKLPLGPGLLRVHGLFSTLRRADSGYLPQAALDAGTLTTYSAIDPTGGGDEVQLSGAVQYQATDESSRTWNMVVYRNAMRDRLYRNDSLFARDPVSGDQQEIASTSVVTGIDVRATFPVVAGQFTTGAQAEITDFHDELWHTQRRQRLASCFDTTGACLNIDGLAHRVSGFVDWDSRSWHGFTIRPGLRLDQLGWRTDDRRDLISFVDRSRSGDTAKARLSPKLSLEYQPHPVVTAVLRAAGGFRATHPIAAVDRNAFAAASRLWSGDAGLVVTPTANWTATATLWGSRNDRYLAWDYRTAEAILTPAEHRWGVDASLRASPHRWVSVGADVAFARSSSIGPKSTRAGTLDGVDQPPRLFASANLRLHWGEQRPGAIDVRGRWLAARQLGRDHSGSPVWSTPMTTIDIALTQHWSRFDFSVAVENALGAYQIADERLITHQTTAGSEPSLGVVAAAGSPRAVFISVGFSPTDLRSSR